MATLLYSPGYSLVVQLISFNDINTERIHAGYYHNTVSGGGNDHQFHHLCV